MEIRPLAEFVAPRPDVEALVVANEPAPLDFLPNLRIVATTGSATTVVRHDL